MANGEHVGGVVGFLQSLNALLRTHRPKECVVVWEGGGSARRRAIYPDYKAKRRPAKLNRFYEDDIPDTLENRDWQVKLLINLMRNLPIRQIYASDCEADDVIGYLTKYSYRRAPVLIVSSDHDYLQLVDNRVTIWSPTSKSIVTRETVKEKTGMYPHNWLIARCFCGDRSDALPGVKGVGLKTMTKGFPELISDQPIEIDDIIKTAESMPTKSRKIYEQVKMNADLGRMNWKLMNLDVSNLSGNQIAHINGALEIPIPAGNKFNLVKTLIKSGIKTFDADNLYLNATLNLRSNKQNV